MLLDKEKGTIMNGKNLLTALLRDIQRPCIYLSEIGEVTGLSDAAIRMNVKRGNIILENTPQPARGKGVKALYPLSDMIEIMALVELGKAGFPLKRTGYHPKAGTGVAFVISNLVLRCLQVKAGHDVKNNAQYGILFFNEDYEGIDIHPSTTAKPDFPDPPSLVWAAIDCNALADKVIEFYRNNAHIFAR